MKYSSAAIMQYSSTADACMKPIRESPGGAVQALMS
jgi:hypothetical protein